ncbi:hypothetical protein [Streptomyces sp. MBT53]|uniref:hypothetical protein n=1 Tax=Streptomyces sp. MBT53 TaxID=1488384 RepID=UPI0019121580|nr:hypothetical protein [Streptomyces sp. MBT53]MBK6012305.1 hypothetical protein [Streptomyces sp. MBT53]
MHAHQAVHNAPLLRLREAIYHVHAKDTRLEPSRQALTGRLETLPVMAAEDRSWNHGTTACSPPQPPCRPRKLVTGTGSP